MAVTLALLSMTCAAGNDVVCKRRMASAASPARHLAAVAVVWIAALAVPAFLAGTFADVTIAWGLLSGAFGIAANLLLLEAMRRGPAGPCATIYRLNLVPATMLAVVALGEHLTPLRAIALAAALGAVALLGGGPVGMPRRALALAIVACLLRAGMGLGYKLGLVAGAPAAQLLLLNGLAWFVGAGLVHLLNARATPWRRADVGWGVVSGLLVTGNTLFLALALSHGPLAVALPVSQLGFVLTTIVGCAAFGEPITRRGVGGTVLAVACVALMAAA